MDAKRTTRISKFLSLVLRHRPERIGLALDGAGWAEIDALLAALARAGRAITREELDAVVANNDKRRYAISPDGRRIRANQGHSIQVDLGYEPAQPPEFLYHGTAEHNVASIRNNGLQRGGRQHVHLSRDRETAVKVGARHGKPVVLAVRAGAMHRAGHKFFLSENGVWLTEAVPAEFLAK